MYYIKCEYGLIINHKKVYRRCKELYILKNQRVIKLKVKLSIASNRVITGSNQLWKMDTKYVYIQGEDKFSYMLNVIDILDRNIVDYHMNFHCKAKDTTSLLRKSLIRRIYLQKMLEDLL